MNKTKQIKKKEQNFTWFFVIVCFLLAGAVLLNMVSSKHSNIVVKDTKNISDWQTYTNTKYGFEFQYPKDWEVKQESDGSIYLTSNLPWPQEGKAFIIRETEKSLAKFIDDYNKSDMLADGTSLSTIFEQKDYSIAGVRADLLKGSTAIGVTSNMIFITHNNRNYVIDFNDQSNNHLQVLKSFKFLDSQNLTNDWQTYTNTKYGFEFQYPKDFILKEVDTQMGNNIGTKLSFDYHGSIQPMSFNIFPAPNYKDSMAAFIGVNNFADNVVKVLEKKNDIININGLLALNYCSIPGYIDYCSTFIMHNNNIFMFDYRDSIPSYYREILSTFKFLDK